MKHKIPYSVKKRVRRFLDIVGNQETVINEREISNFFKKAFAALQFNGITGDYLEFGTGEGFSFSCANTANLRSSKPRRKLWGFDSFEGLPQAQKIDGPEAIQWQSEKDSVYYYENCKASESDVRGAMKKAKVTNYHLFKGWFNKKNG